MCNKLYFDEINVIVYFGLNALIFFPRCVTLHRCRCYISTAVGAILCTEVGAIHRFCPVFHTGGGVVFPGCRCKYTVLAPFFAPGMGKYPRVKADNLFSVKCFLCGVEQKPTVMRNIRCIYFTAKGGFYS